MIRVLLLSIVVATIGSPVFDVQVPQGVNFILENSPTPQKYLIETMPGGAALFDYNNDGLLDIFLVNGGRVTSPMATPDNDGKLDLFVTRYMEWDTRHSKTCGGEWHTYCPPEEFPATTVSPTRQAVAGTQRHLRCLEELTPLAHPGKIAALMPSERPHRPFSDVTHTTPLHRRPRHI